MKLGKPAQAQEEFAAALHIQPHCTSAERGISRARTTGEAEEAFHALEELAQAADRLVDTYAERLAGIQKEANAIQEGLQQESLNEAQLRELRRRGEELTRQLNYFRLPEEASAPTVDNSPLT